MIHKPRHQPLHESDISRTLPVSLPRSTSLDHLFSVALSHILHLMADARHIRPLIGRMTEYVDPCPLQEATTGRRDSIVAVSLLLDISMQRYLQ